MRVKTTKFTKDHEKLFPITLLPFVLFVSFVVNLIMPLQIA